MQPLDELRSLISRRHFLSSGSHLLGSAALASLLGGSRTNAASLELPHAVRTQMAAKAKQVIYLHMVGGPPQMDMFDYKPSLGTWYDKDLPPTVRMGQRLTTMTSGQGRFPIAPPVHRFEQCGQAGIWVSELLPHLKKTVDDLVFVRSMHTEAINHEPAITMLQTGNQITGRPCLGAWASYGLGAINDNLPTFVVMVAKSTNNEELQAISARLWSAGFLPGEHAGVSLRTAGDPILFINDPPGVSRKTRREWLDGLDELNRLDFERNHDPQGMTRIKQYELAFRMQASVPQLVDLSQESASTLELYGDAVKTPGSFANTAILARRMIERGVRFVQIYHNNWDMHSNVTGRLPYQCGDIDQPSFALIQDLKQRGLLDETIVIWGGEFGRTIYSQGGLSPQNYGRDHHPRCFTMWMAGGGFKGGTVYGETDEFSYNIVKDPVHVRDLHATVLKLLGFDHERLTFKHQGLDQKLTGVLPAKVVNEILA